MSTNPSDIGLVCIDWSTQGVISIERVARAGVNHAIDQLADVIDRTVRDGAWWAVDVPFGWPRGFGAWIASHYEQPTEPPAQNPPRDRAWDGVAFRLTDEAARSYAGLSNGINVSFDKLGATAAAWSIIETRLAAKWGRFDRSGLTASGSGHGCVVETWPAAAWRAWHGIDLGRLTWFDFESALTGVVTEPVNQRWNKSGPPTSWPDKVISKQAGHYRDAVVCALVARAASLGLTTHPTMTQEPRAKREGWIHLPRRRDGAPSNSERKADLLDLLVLPAGEPPSAAPSGEDSSYVLEKP